MEKQLTNSTQRAIHTVLAILKTKNALDSFSKADREILEINLAQIAKCAIDDFQKAISNLSYDLQSEISK